MFRKLWLFLAISVVALSSVAGQRERVPYVGIDVLRDKEADYANTKITVAGYVAVDGVAVVFQDLESWLTSSVQSSGVKLNLTSDEGSKFLGCFVSITGTYKLVVPEQKAYWLTDITSIERMSRPYFYAKEQLRERGSDYSPKCIGKIIIEQMAGY